jgi:hypothetical protein
VKAASLRLVPGPGPAFSSPRIHGEVGRGATRAAKYLFELVVLALILLIHPSLARASEETDQLFVSGNAALADGRPGDAIADFEALADRGIVDCGASFNRGLAYANRVRIGAEQPGDLGRAAHGFAEARDLTNDPALSREAGNALITLRSEVARRRARSGDPIELDTGVALGRAIVELLPENAWAGLALFASLALGIGLFLRGAVSDRRQKVAATVACSIAAPLLLGAALLTLGARSERLHLVEGIVVAPTARPADEQGIAVAGAAQIPEAARVEILGDRPGWVHVRRGAQVAWLPSQVVRTLAREE